MSYLPVIICGLTFLLLNQKPYSYGTSAAITPLRDGLDQLENPQVSSSGATSETVSTSKGNVLDKGAGDSRKLLSGSRRMMDRTFESKKSRGSRDAALSIRSSPSNRRPEVAAVQHAKTNRRVDYSQPPVNQASGYRTLHPVNQGSGHHDFYPVNQASGSLDYDYEWYEKNAQLGQANNFQSYGAGYGHQAVHFQPFQMQPRLLHYYQPVAQWGLVPVPIGSHQLTAPAHPYPVEAGLPLGNSYDGTTFNAQNYAHPVASSVTPTMLGQPHERVFRPPILGQADHKRNTHKSYQSRPLNKPESSSGLQSQDLEQRSRGLYNIIKSKSIEMPVLDESEILTGKPDKLVDKLSRNSHLGDKSTNDSKNVKLVAETKDESSLKSSYELPPHKLEQMSRDLYRLIKHESGEMSFVHEKTNVEGSPILTLKPDKLVDKFSRDSQLGGMSTNDPKNVGILAEKKEESPLITEEHGAISPNEKEMKTESPRKLKSTTPSSSETIRRQKEASIKRMDAGVTASPHDVESAVGPGSSSGVRRRRKANFHDRAKSLDFSNLDQSLDFSTLDKIYQKELPLSQFHDSQVPSLSTTSQVKQEKSEIGNKRGTGEKLEVLPAENEGADLHKTQENPTSDASAQENFRMYQPPSPQDPRKGDWIMEAKNTNLEQKDQSVRASKTLPIAKTKNKFHVLSNHIPGEPEELEEIAEDHVQVRDIPEVVKEIQHQSRAKPLGSKLETILTHEKPESLVEGTKKVLESEKESMTRKKINPYGLLDKHRYLWTNALEADTTGIFKLSLNLKSIFSAAKTRGINLFSKTQELLRKKPIPGDDSEGIIMNQSDKPEISALNDSPIGKDMPLAGKRKQSAKKSLSKQNPDNKSKLEQAKGQQKVTVLSEDPPSSSQLQQYHNEDPQSSDGKKVIESKNKMLKENSVQRKQIETLDYEKRYLTKNPNMSKVALHNFRILAETLRVGEKGWDFTIGISWKGLSKTKQIHLLKILKCKTPELKDISEWLTLEIGLPEGMRRFDAIQRQIKQIEILEGWSNALKDPLGQLIQDKLTKLDNIVHLSTPCPTYSELGPKHAEEFESLRNDPVIDRILHHMLSEKELETRLKNMNTMIYRWNPHKWLTEEDIVIINQQALDLRLIVVVGDSLQFGREYMTSTSFVPGFLIPEDSFRMIWNAWTNRDNSKVPWFATPERAWLMMDPARASRYTESLETLKGYLADHPVPNVELISFVDPENKLEPTGNPWWHLGHILSWEDQGLDLFMMANIGMKMKLKWNVRELSDEQNAILKTSKEIPEEKRGQVIDWFHKEIKQSFNNQEVLCES
ncbi:hypothetical protein PCANC_22335 [Puccinia coronata f. sp. avenae]|uniref:Uncharacterized protein n=1 Tax=Puccinia coronata f. sp. avenae TaxID=200324 RepID=A0A2N5SAM8_9BASI|nr:hypothetical protein PCANC_22335 [Puccinia coronata f. sp. avenae]